MTLNIPPNYKLLYSKEHIQAKVQELGSEITPWAKSTKQDTGKDLLAIPVLRGGLFFFADLVRAIDVSVEVMPVRAMAYEPGVVAAQRSDVAISEDELPVAGRHVLLVDEICDTGKTLKALSKRMIELGASSVKSAVCIERVVKEKIFNSDWVGFSYSGPEWFVGYGMDDAEAWRNLGSICIIQK